MFAKFGFGRSLVADAKKKLYNKGPIQIYKRITILLKYATCKGRTQGNRLFE